LHRLGSFTALLQLESFSAAGEALNGRELLSLIEQNMPHIALVDLNMPVMDGITTIQQLNQRFPKVKIIVLTMHNSLPYLQKVANHQVQGYLLKNSGKTELLQAIRSVYAGKLYYSHEIAQLLMEHAHRLHEINTNQQTGSDSLLTRREIEVLRLLGEEYTTKEIADKLFLSAHTVETHRKNLLHKLQVKNTVGLYGMPLSKSLSREPVRRDTLFS
jgi:DNA-binding NarL/FixJ family response regulator